MAMNWRKTSKSITCMVAVLAVAVLLSPALAAEPPADFDTWLSGVRTEAQARGIAAATLDVAFNGVRPIDRVIALDRQQPEFSLDFAHYMAAVVTPERVAEGRRQLARHKGLLKAIQRRFGVPGNVIVAMWGIESAYGRNIGSFPAVSVLATLAYDGRRSQYFRGELFKALEMVEAGVPPARMQGSWAGALGQCQFMPSTYRAYAVHWRTGQDAPPDIWDNTADVFASAANYLSGIGWVRGEGWGRAVKLPAGGLPDTLVGLDTVKSLKEWRKLGVRLANGKPLPNSAKSRASLIRPPGPGGDKGPPFLVTDNFRVYMKWNRSTLFGLAAGTLADRIGTR
jgi:membrane-bound lytic murein transglycosylase B